MTTSLKHSNTDPRLRNDEAARYLGVSPNQLRRARCTGELFKGCKAPGFVRQGRAIRYKKSKLDEWLNGLPEFNNTAEYQSSK